MAFAQASRTVLSTNTTGRKCFFRWSRLNDRAREKNTLLRCPSNVLNIPNPHKGNSEGEQKTARARGRLASRIPTGLRVSVQHSRTNSQSVGYTADGRRTRVRGSIDPDTCTRLHAVAASGAAAATSSVVDDDARSPAERVSRIGSYLVDPASSHMLVSKIKPCMSKHKLLHSEAANGSLGHP
jgi:hypothetical protein